jgi:hypothetical protein
MARTVFYAWQSDLPNRTNRGFIGECLQQAIEELRLSDVTADGLEIDRDTLNTQGSAEIARTILDKIEHCDVFVADVTIINSTAPDNYRRTSNPNILIELGYAANARSWERMICLCNTAFGRVEDLPFDIRHRTVTTYSLSEDATDKSQVRKQLVGLLKHRITAILSGNLPVLARELRTFFNEIDRNIMVQILQGTRSIVVNVPASHVIKLQELVGDPTFTQLATFQSNGNFLWNDPQGPRNGYIVTVTQTLVDILT